MDTKTFDRDRATGAPRQLARRLGAALLGVALAATLGATGCALFEPSAKSLKSDARSDLAHGRDTDALNALRAATERDPSDGEAFYMLGAAALRQGHLDEAEMALSRAVELQPRNPKWLAAYGLSLREQARYEEAERELLRALFLRPGDPSTLAALAEVYRLSGQPEKCAARYDQFVWFVEQGEGGVGELQQRALADARERVRECEAAASSAAVGPASVGPATP